jgi:hypothetical protein
MLPRIPWKQIADLRGTVIHDYFGVSLNIVWAVVQKYLPPLRHAPPITDRAGARNALAIGPRDRQAGYRHCLASQGLPDVLGVEVAAGPRRASSHFGRCRGAHTTAASRERCAPQIFRGPFAEPIPLRRSGGPVHRRALPSP